MLSAFSLYLLCGSLVGILAGLLGVGGGLIIVPLLAAIFNSQGMSPDIIMHLALGTSLASIMATSLSSVYSHHQHRAVIWPMAFRLSPGVLLGAWSGGLLAGYLSGEILKPLFAVFELLVAAYMLWGGRTRSQGNTASWLDYGLGGGLIGMISSLVGIGGGTMTVPWLMWYGSSIHRAIATSAAVGFPIALAGSFSYLLSGWAQPLLPDYALGYIYLPALLGISLSSILFAPLGAKWAHNLPVKQLKKIFAVLLILLALYLLSLN